MGKNVLFLACRSVRNSFLKFLVPVLGPQTWPPRAKKPEFGFQTYIFSRAQKWKGGLPNNFSRFFGMYLSPPDHPKCPGFGLWVYGISRKRHPKRPGFGVAVLEFEYPVLEFEYRKRAGISRVKIVQQFTQTPLFLEEKKSWKLTLPGETAEEFACSRQRHVEIPNKNKVQ